MDNYKQAIKKFEKYKAWFKPGSRKEKLKRWMEVPAKEKLEWLEEMCKLILKYASKRELELIQKLREIN